MKRLTFLQVYTGYRFYVRACSRVGCTNSDVVTISTAQLPPTFVASPTLTVLGVYSVPRVYVKVFYQMTESRKITQHFSLYRIGIMVCLHCPTPRLIQIPIKIACMEFLKAFVLLMIHHFNESDLI